MFLTSCSSILICIYEYLRGGLITLSKFRPVYVDCNFSPILMNRINVMGDNNMMLSENGEKYENDLIEQK
jgi:hypothetical protein